MILESDLADIDKETTLTANTLSNKEKETLQLERYETRIRSEGVVPSDKAKTTILLDVLFQWSTHLNSQKTQRVERLPTCTAAVTRSPMTLRDMPLHVVRYKRLHINCSKCKDELTTSRYYI